MVQDLLRDEEEAKPLAFVDSATESGGVQAVATSMRATLPISLATFRAQKDASAAFDALREAAEAIGVFVLLAGDLGSHHSALDVRAFRGFALADAYAPFVVINDNDARSAWSFTLLHELAHVWLGQTGVSGGVPDRSTERFCNDVASEFLLPENEVREIHWASEGGLRSEVANFAAERRISGSMVSYKLYRVGLINRDAWLALRSHFESLWEQARARRREQAQGKEGGPSFYIVRRHRLGRALVGLAARTMASGALSTTAASRILGVKPRQVGQLLERAASVPRAAG